MVRLLLLLLVPLTDARAGESPDAILARVRAANQLQSAIETLEMTIRPKSGPVTVRAVEIRMRRDADAIRTHVRILSPADVANVQLLQIDSAGTGNDQQYLYLPTNGGRVMRLAAANRKGNFVGSDFTFEDLALRDGASGVGSTLIEDTADHWVVDTPLTGSSYASVRSTIGKADLIARRIEFRDGAGAVVKLLEVTKTETEGAITIPVETVMTNIAKGSNTTLKITQRALNVDEATLPDDTFTPAYLSRG